MFRTRLLQYGLGVLGAVVAICVWQLAATAGPLAGSPLPTAGESFTALLGLLGSGEMWVATGVTVLTAFLGILLAAAGGILLGVWIGVSPLAMHATRVPIEFLKPIPPIVILPIAVLVLGPTADMAVFIVFFGCFISIAVQAAAGVFDTDPVARDTGRSYGMTRSRILLNIVLPSALPYIGTALRVAAPTSLIAVVVAGLLGGAPGLGQSLLLAQLDGDRPRLFAYVLILGVLGLLAQGTATVVERRLLHWHPQYRKAVDG
ncbi:MAG: ABC transporter permease subunit [Microbacterium sp.]